jgi:aryl-alcohol dehydrogenase-like predicted oxidoreductase
LKKKTGIQIDSKISSADCNSLKSILNSIQLSLDKIQIDHLGVLYLHDENALFQSNYPNLIRNLEKLKELGYFRKIGVSIYSVDQLEKISINFPQIDVFQVPENICDRRLRNSELVQNLAAEGTEFVVRSIFLQGLLLMKPVEIHSRMSSAIPAIESLHKFASQEKRSLTDLCLAYAMNLNWSTGVIISAYNAQQLRQINTSSNLLPSNWEKEVEVVADDCIDPRNWST